VTKLPSPSRPPCLASRPAWSRVLSQSPHGGLHTGGMGHHRRTGRLGRAADCTHEFQRVAVRLVRKQNSSCDRHRRRRLQAGYLAITPHILTGSQRSSSAFATAPSSANSAGTSRGFCCGIPPRRLRPSPRSRRNETPRHPDGLPCGARFAHGVGGSTGTVAVTAPSDRLPSAISGMHSCCTSTHRPAAGSR
jgi:hypothetical protein